MTAMRSPVVNLGSSSASTMVSARASSARSTTTTVDGEESEVGECAQAGRTGGRLWSRLVVAPRASQSPARSAPRVRQPCRSQSPGPIAPRAMVVRAATAVMKLSAQKPTSDVEWRLGREGARHQGDDQQRGDCGLASTGRESADGCDVVNAMPCGEASRNERVLARPEQTRRLGRPASGDRPDGLRGSPVLLRRPGADDRTAWTSRAGATGSWSGRRSRRRRARRRRRGRAVERWRLARPRGRHPSGSGQAPGHG